MGEVTPAQCPSCMRGSLVPKGGTARRSALAAGHRSHGSGGVGIPSFPRILGWTPTDPCPTVSPMPKCSFAGTVDVGVAQTEECVHSLMPFAGGRNEPGQSQRAVQVSLHPDGVG
jgi:hypothetical protein